MKVLVRLPPLAVLALALALALAPGCKRPCEADSDCDDRNACTADVCTSGQCTNPAVALDDGNPCTEDSCDPTLGIRRASVEVDDGNACTLDWCQPSGGEQHARTYVGACFATRLRFRPVPTIVEAEKNILPAVEVEVQGPDGGVALDSTASVSLALNAGGQPASLAGTATVAAVAGVARFEDVRVTAVASDVTLEATAPALEQGTSSVFDVLAPCPVGQIRGSGGTCVDYCSTGTNPCTAPPAASCSGNSAINPQSPGTCTVELGPPYYSCVYSNLNTPCISPSDDCPTATQRRQRTSTCVVTAGVAGCRVDTVLTECSTGGQVCYQGACVSPPTITAVSPGAPNAAALGATLVVTGTGFTGATAVTIGNAAQSFTVDSATQITIGALSEATPLGAQNVVVSNFGTTSVGFAITVVRLVINEVEAQNPGADTAEFVEVLAVTTPQAAVNLSGYVLVLFRANGVSAPTAYNRAALGNTDANGFWLAGSASQTPDALLADSAIRNGIDAVAIYQGATTDFPNTANPTPIRLIDAVVYDGSTDNDFQIPSLAARLLVSGGQALVDEDVGDGGDTNSLQRCSTAGAFATARRDNRAFACVGLPSPRVANP